MPVLADWSLGPAVPSLGPVDIDVWRFGLDLRAAELASLERSLSPDERARAARFVFPRDRDRFIAGRGALRDVLARYVGEPASEISFDYEAAGKPHIRRPSTLGVQFNLSHSHGLAVCAVGRHRTIGVDLEALRPEVAGEEIAVNYFSARELEELRALPTPQRVEGFFLCWTRKEAYIKARGGGLAKIPLDSFDVTLTPGREERLERAGDAERWTIRSFAPAEHYVAAIVVEGRDVALRYWSWAPR
jgi:4'-phosphopantetheinyl transferase